MGVSIWESGRVITTVVSTHQLLMPPKHAYSSANPNRNQNSFTEEQKRNIIVKVSEITCDCLHCHMTVLSYHVTRSYSRAITSPPLEGELHIREGKKSSFE